MVIKNIKTVSLFIIVASCVIGLFSISGCKEESKLEGPDLTVEEVDFTFTEITPGKFVFKSLSKSTAGFAWDFGEGLFEDTSSSPTHSYFNPGNYTVSLTVMEGTIPKTGTKTITVNTVAKPTSVFLKGLEVTKNMMLERENDKTGPDIFFYFYRDWVRIKAIDVKENMPTNEYLSIKIPLAEEKLDPLTSLFSLQFCEKSNNLPDYEITSFSFTPNKLTPVKYPVKLHFDNYKFACDVILEWR